MTRFKQHTDLPPEIVKKKLNEFFAEDCIERDITTSSTQKKGHVVKAVFVAKEPLVFAGKEIINQGFSDCTVHKIVNDGESLNKGGVISIISGNIDIILKLHPLYNPSNLELKLPDNFSIFERPLDSKIIPCTQPKPLISIISGNNFFTLFNDDDHKNYNSNYRNGFCHRTIYKID